MLHRQNRKIFSSIICICLTLSMIIAYIPMIAFAEEAHTASLKFSARDLENGSVFYKIGDDERVEISAENADGGGAIWINNIKPEEQPVTVYAEPAEGYELNNIQVAEGEEEDASPAYNGNFDNQNGTYTFPLRECTYVVNVDFREIGSGSGDEGGGQDNAETVSLKFNEADLADLNFTYRIDLPDNAVAAENDPTPYGVTTAVDGGQAEHGAIWIRNFRSGSRVTINVTLKENVQGTLKDKIEGFKATEGEEEDAPPAYDGVFSFDKDGTTGTYSFDANNARDFAVKVDYKENGDNPPGPGEGQDQGHYESATVNYSYPNSTGADILINGRLVENPYLFDESKTSYTKETSFYVLDGEDTVEIKLGVFFIEKLTKIVINGVDYSSAIPKSKEQLLDAFHEQKNWTTITVPLSDTYNIETKQAAASISKGEIVIGNFLWTNSKEDPNAPADDLIDGGKIRLVKAVYDGDVLYDVNKGVNELEPLSSKDWDDNESGTVGSAVFPEGTALTVKLIPDYGKQLVSFGINDSTFDVGDSKNISTYTFVVKAGNSHLAATFKDVANTTKINGTNSKVNSASFTTTGDAVDYGTLNLDITSAKTDKSNAVAAVEMTMENVVYAGENKANDDWTREVSKLNKSANITMDVDGVAAGDTVKVIREHDGKEDTLSAVVNKDGTVSFKTDRFSKYTIIKTAGKIKTATLSYTETTYTGKAKTPTVTVKNSAGKVLSKDKDYKVAYKNNKNAGTATVTITGAGIYSGSVLTKTFKIIPKSISAFTSKVEYTGTTYNGSAKKPSVTVKNAEGANLVKETDYKVTYTNNTKVGKATVTITGAGNYNGKITKTFKITPKKPVISSIKPGTGKLTIKMKTKVSSTGGTTYKIAYKASGTSTWRYTTTTSQSKEIKGLKKGKKYSIKVCATKEIGSAPYTSAWTAVKTSGAVK